MFRALICLLSGGAVYITIVIFFARFTPNLLAASRHNTHKKFYVQ
jgi:hypothetical protein